VTNLQWQGWWRDPDQLRSIEIRPEKNGKLSVIGNGIYQGHYFDSDGTAHPEPYYRDFRFTALVNQSPFTYKEPFSKTAWSPIPPRYPHYIDFLLIGKYLIVNDMLDLGGNVNFSAIYQKHRAKPMSRNSGLKSSSY